MSDDLPRRLAVIVGAGASFDCGAQGVVDNNWRPPLVSHLFDPHGTFSYILNRFPGAENFADEIRGAVAHGTEGFETVLRSFARSPNLNVRRDYRQVPLYLQEVIGDVSMLYIQGGGSAYNTLVRRIDTSTYTNVCYVTVNYDLFLDRALERHYDLQFQSMADYTPSHARWSLIKLHGSVNWGRQLVNGTTDSATHPIERIRCVPVQDDLSLGPLEVLTGYKDHHRVRDGWFYYPALAAPIGDKDTFICDPAQLSAARAFLSECSDFLFIGFSGLDAHVLALLKDVTCVGNTAIVNGNQDNGRDLVLRLNAANPLFGSGEVTSSIYPVGFGRFLSEGRFNAFLQKASSSVPA